MDLPLYGQASNFIATDTFVLDFSTYQKVKAAEFKFVTENGLPLSVDIQGYFMDDNGLILDSLLQQKERVVAAAPVDGEGIVTNTVEETKYIDIPADRFAQIRSAKKLLLLASFSTLNNGEIPVKILSGQSTDIRLGAI